MGSGHTLSRTRSAADVRVRGTAGNEVAQVWDPSTVERDLLRKAGPAGTMS